MERAHPITVCATQTVFTLLSCNQYVTKRKEMELNIMADFWFQYELCDSGNLEDILRFSCLADTLNQIHVCYV